jgi:hypothetical protein
MSAIAQANSTVNKNLPIERHLVINHPPKTQLLERGTRRSLVSVPKRYKKSPPAPFSSNWRLADS